MPRNKRPKRYSSATVVWTIKRWNHVILNEPVEDAEAFAQAVLHAGEGTIYDVTDEGNHGEIISIDEVELGEPDDEEEED